jgi:hypothetical protein
MPNPNPRWLGSSGASARTTSTVRQVWPAGTWSSSRNVQNSGSAITCLPITATSIALLQQLQTLLQQHRRLVSAAA